MYARPASSFAARFIGTPAMNLIALEDGRIAGSQVTLGSGAAQFMGLRPEAISVFPESATEQATVPAAVVGQEYLGADLVLRCQVGREVLTVRAPGSQPVPCAARLRLGWNAEDMHFFGRDGLRLS